jgi:TPP-dependent pyruvate/acetoin dehydrogenase alpha subunit
MDDRDLEPLMNSLGQAVFAAQIFEMNLGSTLIALRLAKGGSSEFADEAAARTWLDHVARQPIGRLKTEIASLQLLSEQEIDEIAEINELRIAVAHHFMSHWTEQLESHDGRARAIAHLKTSTETFLGATFRLQSRLASLKAAVSGG